MVDDITRDYESIREKPGLHSKINTKLVLIVIVIGIVVYFLIGIIKPQFNIINYIPVGILLVVGYIYLTRQKIVPDRILSLWEAQQVLYNDLHNNIKIQKFFPHGLPKRDGVYGDIIIDGHGDLMMSPWDGQPWRYFVPFTILIKQTNEKYYYLGFVSPRYDGAGLIGSRKLTRPWTGYDMDKIVVYKGFKEGAEPFGSR